MTTSAAFTLLLNAKVMGRKPPFMDQKALSLPSHPPGRPLSKKAEVGPRSCRVSFGGGGVLMACLQTGLANAFYLMKTRYQSEAKRTPFSTLNIYICI